MPPVFPLYKVICVNSLLFAVGNVAVGQGSLKIQQFSFPSDSEIGKRVSATCTPASGEKMEFKWLKNGKELIKGLNIDIRSYSDLSNLVIDPLTEDDTGNYTCIVNSGGRTGSY
ncbi:hypothetical protein X975_25957, partial [Stegodyphus mimosarum]